MNNAPLMKKATPLLFGSFVLLLLILSGALVLAPQMMAPVSSRASGGMATTSVAPMLYAEDQMALQDSFAVEGKIAMPPIDTPTAGQTAAESDQKIIRTGSLVLVVDEVRETTKTIGTIAEEAVGYVQASNVSERGDGALYGSVTIRIPSERFSDTVTATKNLATLVQDETTNAQDVTEEYTDLDAQLRNAKAQETEYLEILARAESVQDILAVQSYLSGTRAQIEQLQGRLQYLENRTAYATLTIELSEEPSIMAPTQDFRPGSAAHEAIQALVVLLQGLVVLGIWTVIIGGPFILLLGLIVFLCAKLLRHLMKSAK